MTEKCSALLLDTGFSALPIYEHLQTLELDLWVMGNRPDDVVARLAGERWIRQDYSQVDAVRDHIRERGITHVVPGCTDVSMETCVRLSGYAAIDPPAAHAALSNKQLFRRLCAAIEVPAPTAFAIDSFPRKGQFICKPVDAFSGRGITTFDGMEREQLAAALLLAQSASSAGDFVIEQFVAGELHSYTAFIESRQVVEAFVVREGSSSNRFAVDTSYVVTDMAAKALNTLRTSIERICAELQLKDGLLHTQFILKGEDVFLIEITRRCPGDLYALLIEFTTGYRYAAKYASFFLNKELSTQANLSANIVRHTVSSPRGCVNVGLRMSHEATLRAYYPLQAMGEVLLPAQRSRAGILFASTPAPAMMEALFDSFIARQVYFDGN